MLEIFLIPFHSFLAPTAFVSTSRFFHKRPTPVRMHHACFLPYENHVLLQDRAYTQPLSTLDVIYLRCNVIDHNVWYRLIQRVECDPKIFAFVTHTLISIQLGVHFFLATHFLNCEYVVVTLNNGSVMKGFFNFLARVSRRSYTPNLKN